MAHSVQERQFDKLGTIREGYGGRTLEGVYMGIEADPKPPLKQKLVNQVIKFPLKGRVS